MRLLNKINLALILFASPVAAWEWSALNLELPPSLHAPEAPEAPANKVFELPTFSGQTPDFHNVPVLDRQPPRTDFDAVFATVLACYPQKSMFRLDIEAQAVASTASLLNQDNTAAGRHYVQIVAKMPLFSTTEYDRVTQFEANIRAKIAEDITAFFEALAMSTQAHRELGLYSTLESRSQARVARGLVDMSEQVEYAKRSIEAAQKVTKWDTAIDGLRVKLTAYCRDSQIPVVSSYLQQVQAQVGPQPAPVVVPPQPVIDDYKSAAYGTDE